MKLKRHFLESYKKALLILSISMEKLYLQFNETRFWWTKDKNKQNI